MENDLKRKAVSSLAWRFMERCGAQGVSFIVSILFTYIASRHKSFKFAHILAVIIPILLVTFRDEKVGTELYDLIISEQE